MARRQLLIVEDEAIVAGLLKETLATEDFEIGVAHTTSQANALAKALDPDIAIIDINLGQGPSGVDLAYILQKKCPGIAILFLTHHPDLRTAGVRVHDLIGPFGFLRKSSVKSKTEILKALDELVTRGEVVRDDNDPARPLATLTKTQVEVLRMTAQGYTNIEIAKRRGTSVNAVEQVLNSIFASLGISISSGINPRVEAVRQFIEIAGKPERRD